MRSDVWSSGDLNPADEIEYIVEAGVTRGESLSYTFLGQNYNIESAMPNKPTVRKF